MLVKLPPTPRKVAQRYYPWVKSNFRLMLVALVSGALVLWFATHLWHIPLIWAFGTEFPAQLKDKQIDIVGHGSNQFVISFTFVVDGIDYRQSVKTNRQTFFQLEDGQKFSVRALKSSPRLSPQVRLPGHNIPGTSFLVWTTAFLCANFFVVIALVFTRTRQMQQFLAHGTVADGKVVGKRYGSSPLGRICLVRYQWVDRSDPDFVAGVIPMPSYECERRVSKGLFHKLSEGEPVTIIFHRRYPLVLSLIIDPSEYDVSA